jgi:hypothetical protein
MVTIVIILSLILLIPFILLLYLGIFFGLNYLRNRNAPLRTVPAEVTRKWSRAYQPEVFDYPLFLIRPVMVLLPATAALFQQWIYRTVFSLGDEKLEFGVPEKAYIARKEGELGMLTYKGDKFLDFRPLPVEEWAALISCQSPAPVSEQASPLPPPPDKSKWDKMPRIS